MPVDKRTDLLSANLLVEWFFKGDRLISHLGYKFEINHQNMKLTAFIEKSDNGWYKGQVEGCVAHWSSIIFFNFFCNHQVTNSTSAQSVYDIVFHLLFGLANCFNNRIKQDEFIYEVNDKIMREKENDGDTKRVKKIQFIKPPTSKAYINTQWNHNK